MCGSQKCKKSKTPHVRRVGEFSHSAGHLLVTSKSASQCEAFSP